MAPWTKRLLLHLMLSHYFPSRALHPTDACPRLLQVACDHLDTVSDTVHFTKDDISELVQVARTTLSSKMCVPPHPSIQPPTLSLQPPNPSLQPTPRLVPLLRWTEGATSIKPDV